jgi:hypothetical protein
MSTDPYSPPTAVVDDTTPEPPGRPRLVWVISGWLVVGSLGSLLMQALQLSGRIPDVGGITHTMHWYDHVFGVIMGIAWIVGSVLLFRLQRLAWRWFASLFAITVVKFLYHLATNPAYREVLAQSRYWGVVAGLAIYAAITYYVYRLHRDGVLRD